MSDSVSVVIPTHERPAALARLLSSLELDLGQVEVVVVDDGSRPFIYDRMQADFPTIRWLREPRSGPATARNTGWRATAGDIVVFVDDDCVLTPGSLSLLAKELEDHDAVGATIEPLERGRLIADFMHVEHLVSHKVENGEVRWLVTACVGVRRAVLESVGGFDEHLTHGGEDVDLSMRLKKAGLRLGVCSDAVALHDHRAGFAQLVRTYYRHGSGQRRLAARHPERRSDLARSSRSRLSPAAWATTYREYRVEEGRLTSAAFVGLRFLMMVPWLVGAVRGSERPSR